MENIQFFILSCAKSDAVASELDMFQPNDLFEEKNIPKVINCLIAFEGIYYIIVIVLKIDENRYCQESWF